MFPFIWSGASIIVLLIYVVGTMLVTLLAQLFFDKQTFIEKTVYKALLGCTMLFMCGFYIFYPLATLVEDNANQKALQTYQPDLKLYLRDLHQNQEKEFLTQWDTLCDSLCDRKNIETVEEWKKCRNDASKTCFVRHLNDEEMAELVKPSDYQTFKKQMSRLKVVLAICLFMTIIMIAMLPSKEIKGEHDVIVLGYLLWLIFGLYMTSLHTEKYIHEHILTPWFQSSTVAHISDYGNTQTQKEIKLYIQKYCKNHVCHAAKYPLIKK